MRDNDLIYMAGNGLIVCAFHDGDIVNFFGPPYSSPSLFGSRFILGEGVNKSLPRHLDKAGVWQLDIGRGNDYFAGITDFALPGEPCLVRHIETTEDIVLELGPCAGRTELFDYDIYADGSAPEKGFLIKTRGGNFVYNDYPLPFPQFYRLVVRGDARIERRAPFVYEITASGSADVLIIGGPSYPECLAACERVDRLTYDAMLEKTLAFWADEFADVTASSLVPDNVPERDRLLHLIDDTVINLIVQQSDAGGVLAGYPFPLGYVRDQYGVCMCMLRLGMFRRARKMLGFYIDVFRRSGKVLNAQGLGVPGLFHFAENDSTEITGYLLLQFFRYAEATGDFGLLRDNIDFLVWLFREQLSQVHNDMLPFNGDETYIAGWILPRDVINEGSAEATMLFVLSGRRLLAFLRDVDPGAIDIERAESILRAVEGRYRDNFVLDGKYTLNNASRLTGLSEPLFRYGVCMNLGSYAAEFGRGDEDGSAAGADDAAGEDAAAGANDATGEDAAAEADDAAGGDAAAEADDATSEDNGGHGEPGPDDDDCGCTPGPDGDTGGSDCTPGPDNDDGGGDREPGPDDDTGGGCVFFGWTSHCAEGVYLCPKCKSRGLIPKRINKRFFVPSALLMPAYLGSPLPGDDIVLATLCDFVANATFDGTSGFSVFKGRYIGYDYGLLLINFLKYDLPDKDRVYRKILSLADNAGTWSERYVDDNFDGCRYRPWESAINLDALLQYCQSLRRQ